MASEVPPLRIQKGSGNSNGTSLSPSKLPRVTHRPLSELSPMAIRRNSPSFPQAKMSTTEKSPVASSPFSTTSPRLFWQGRDPNSPAREVTESPPVPSPRKRSSIENLKKASRVKNSSMFEIEQRTHYDPSRPSILDGRPLSNQYLRESSSFRTSDTGRKENVAPGNTISPARSPVKELEEDLTDSTDIVNPLSPSRLNISPTKSSLSKKTGMAFRHSGFNADTGVWEDDEEIQEKHLPSGRGLHRHNKSVTFDQAPPQVNEYEMTTPAPSSNASGSREGSYDSADDDEEEEEVSFERGSSMDHDDSFDASLEDTEKTPVVLPEDWRFMSPDTANTDLAKHEEDVFEDEFGSPAPTAQPGTVSHRPHQTSASSVDSNGQSRPLPPLPPMLGAQDKPRSDSLTNAFERISVASRTLPTPPKPAATSKVDILNMRISTSLSAEDRVRLLSLQEQERERRMRRMGSKDPSPVRNTTADESAISELEPVPVVFESRNTTPQLSRDSILAGLRGQAGADSRDSSEDIPDLPQRDLASLDPDVAIPSMEDPTQPRIKEEDTEENELYSIPDMYNRRAVSDSDVSFTNDDDLTSQYSQPSLASFLPTTTDDGQDTPKAQSPAREVPPKPIESERVSLPDFDDFGKASSFDMGFAPYLTNKEEKSKPAIVPTPMTDLPDLAALRQSIQRSYTPDIQTNQQFATQHTFSPEQAVPGTPESVVRHPTAFESFSSRIKAEPLHRVSEPEVESNRSFSPSEPSETGSVLVNEREGSPVSAISIGVDDKPELMVTEPPNNELTNARPSEAQTLLAEQKRVSSLVPLDIPRGSMDDGLGLGLEKAFDRVVEAQKVEFELSLQRLYYPFNGRFPSSEVPLPSVDDRTVSNPMENVPILPKPRGARPPRGTSLLASPIAPGDAESFANRAVGRQRGYLMRQNTKIVVASERVSHDECRSPALPTVTEGGLLGVPTEANHVVPSPRKTSQPTWTAEPWNGKTRRKSIRVGGEKAVTKRKPVEGPVPPLPGHTSNAQESLGVVAEDELGEEEEWEEGAERGRLFVKVVGVKDLQMPFPQHERTYFALTLDNGMHCVTTAWLELARSAPIGQEFELVVLDDLEFQLTLQMKLEEPKVERPQSPSKPPASPKKQGAFGRLFGSPKKKKDSEIRAQQEAQAVRRPVTPPSAYELVQGLVAKDGSFARAYVALSAHEKQAYGRPYNVDITCFNEWALEEVHVGSSRSKKSTQLQRRPPYEIGKLELQLLYVPKPKGVKDEDMPKSMNGAVRALREAEDRMQHQANIKEFEGYLSQQGGDCPYWRRRFFKLTGTKLTAFHETTLQPRATINLAKATRLIDDKTALTQREITTKGGGRRKSGFAEEEEGYMFVEEGFRIRFANGEVIDFYADATANKDEWMQALSQVVGKGMQSSSAPVKGWADLVLKKEKKLKAEASAPAQRPRTGHQRTETYHASGALSQANSPVKSSAREDRQRKARSMMI
ncbi:Bud site selection protein bud4 [Cladophialophora chaetospira]|uniref:Bud site selection protein bud4 n=1 Tax=Cladophialophora chaetospira TaxID=386627 RepID=A0AA39CGZ4_9EURO|nr:Bud site selection protein bud4 [Cladophialophora chaetospira]